MRFYIRPGPAKAQLYDVITSGGGILCRIREPGAILLTDPNEALGTSDNSGQFYVSTQYIWDCVKENQQLDEKNYRLRTTQKIQTRSLRSKEGAVGRMSYTAEEDEAILNFISKRLTEARGNAVWQLMEKQKVTSHSWQSMKDRYLKHLRDRPVKSQIGRLEFVSTPKPQKDTAQQLALESSAKSLENEPNALCSADPHAVLWATTDCSSEEKADHTDKEALDGDTITDLASGQRTPVECTEGNIAAVSKDEHGASSPRRSRLEDGDENQEISGDDVAPEARGLQTSKMTTKRRLGILDRAVSEFRNSLWIEDDSQLHTTPSDPSAADSETEMPNEVQEGELAALPPQHKKKKESSRPGQDTTAGYGQGTKTRSVNSCRSHLFLFEGESQEDDLSQTSLKEGCASLPVSVEGEREVFNLMKHSGKNLIDVIKALLKTSGDIALAHQHFLQGRFPEVLWSKKEDQLLLSADPASKCRLEEKYGRERVSARIAFLQTE